MKLYLKNHSEKYVEVSFLSIMKAHFFSSLAWMGIGYVILTVIVNIVESVI